MEHDDTKANKANN